MLCGELDCFSKCYKNRLIEANHIPFQVCLRKAPSPMVQQLCPYEMLVDVVAGTQFSDPRMS